LPMKPRPMLPPPYITAFFMRTPSF